MRRLIAFLPLALGQCLSGSTSATMAQIAGQPIVIASEPVALDSETGGRTRLGALTFLDGWRLSSETRWFGGLSSLVVDGANVTALSDAGAIVRFRIGRFGHASEGRIDPLPPGCGPTADKADRDTESLTRDPAGRHWWIGYEVRNAICRTDGRFRNGVASAPPAMARWRSRRGAETMLRLRDGRFLVLAEGATVKTMRDRDLLIFDRDPVDPAARFTRLYYRPPEGFSPTDAAQLPDGRILILNRRFSLLDLFQVQIVTVDLRGKLPGARIEGQPVAAFAPPVVTDNYEGIAVTREADRTIVWIVSDDNYMRWQRTLLLKFAFDG